MATTEEIQIFRSLIERWISDERAKKIIRQAKEWWVVSEPRERVSGSTWLAQKALQRAETFWEEVKQVSDEPISDDIIAREQIEDPRLTSERQDILTPEKLEWIAQEERQIEQEKEEGVQWFVTETSEALKERLWNLKEIAQRKLKQWWEALWKATQAFAEWEATEAVWELFKWQLNAVWGGTLQIWGQLVWAGGDIIWEWLENAIQDATPEVVEDTIEWAISSIWDAEIVQKIAESYQEFSQNNPESAKNIEAVLNISEIIPIFKWKKIIWKKLPFTKEWKVAKLETKRLKDKSIKDNVNTLIWTTSAKIEDRDLIDFWNLAKQNRSQIKWTKDFDQLSTVVWNIGIRDINLLNNKLKWVKKNFRPQWAKEALNEMKQNLDKINFKTSDKAEINKLIKKFDKEWLTLTELNNIKKSINKYTRWWSKSWLEWAWLRAESARDKYSEVMKFIENTADREWITNVKELNRNWAISDKFSWLLQQQARKAWVKWVKEQITKPSLIWRAIRKWREWISAPFTKADPIDTSIIAIEKNLSKLIDNITK